MWIVSCVQAMGDLCMEPANYAEHIISSQYGPAIADYYVHCPSDGAVKESGPLNTLVRQARLNIDKSEQLVAEFVTLAESHYSPKDVSLSTLLFYFPLDVFIPHPAGI